MLLVLMDKPTQFVSFILAVSKISDELKLHFSPDKLWFRGMDSAHVSMIDFEIPKDYFSKYEVEEEKIVCVLLEKLIKFLRGVKKNEKLELSLDEGSGKLKARIIGGYIREFMTPLMDVGEAAELGVPRVELPVMVKITCDALNAALKEVKQISDKVRLVASETELQIRGESDEGYEAAVSLRYDGMEVLEKEVKQEANAVYNVDIMGGIVRELSRVSEIVSIKFGTDLPLKLEFDIPEGGKFHFYLAPRIE